MVNYALICWECGSLPADDGACPANDCPAHRLVIGSGPYMSQLIYWRAGYRPWLPLPEPQEVPA